MEGSHRKLCTGLSYGLSRYDTDSLTDLYSVACRHIGSVALRADAVFAAAGKYCPDTDLLDRLAVPDA